MEMQFAKYAKLNMFINIVVRVKFKFDYKQMFTAKNGEK